MDVVVLGQSGIDYAVATLGTAATDTHIQRLFRAVDDVVFCFDGDEAGRRAAWRAAENALASMKGGRQALFLFLPEGEDPDSLVRAEGRHAFESRLDDAVPLSRFLFDHLTTGVDLDTPEGRARLVDSLPPHIGRIPPGPYRRQLQMRLAELSGDTTPIATDRASGQRRVHPGHHQASGSPVRRAIRMLLHEPSLAGHTGDVGRLRGTDVAGADLLAELIELLHARPELTTGVLLEHYRGPNGAGGWRCLPTANRRSRIGGSSRGVRRLPALGIRTCRPTTGPGGASRHSKAGVRPS